LYCIGYWQPAPDPLGSRTVRVGLRQGLGVGFRCKRIIDSWLPVRDPCGSGTGCRYWIHDQ